ncbi:MAG: DMT family transporter [Bacillota bacterium]|nr:DMT family transporter [Bacillota bacterium]
MENKRSKVLLALILAPIFWSTGGILIKLVDWNPVAIAGTRSGISAIIIYFYIVIFKKNVDRSKLLSKDKYKWIGAVFYASTVILFVVANKITTAANVIFLQYTAPVWVALFSGWILKEKVRRLDWLVIFFVMIGMVLFFVGDLEVGQMIGNVLGVFSGVGFASVIILMKMQEKSEAIEIVFLGNLMTLLFSTPFLFLSVPDMKSIIGLILLGVFQLGFAYILFSEAIKKVSAIEAILIPTIEPILNPIWVFIFIGEKPGKFAILGGIIVISSILFRSIIASVKSKS